MIYPLNRRQEIVLTDCRLDRQSSMPLYQQINNWLLNSIGRGELSSGDAIPSKTQLAAVLKVSRATVRQTLYELRFEGYTVSYSKTLQQTCRDLFSMMFVPSGPLFLKTLSLESNHRCDSVPRHSVEPFHLFLILISGGQV